MASTFFVNGVTLSDSGWFNDGDALIYPPTLLGTALTYAFASYTGTTTGTTAGVTGTIKYTIIGNMVMLDIAQFAATSNATTFTITGGPVAIRPTSSKQFPAFCADNSGALVMGVAAMDSSGVLILAPTTANNPSGWTNAGTKTLGAMSVCYTKA